MKKNIFLVTLSGGPCGGKTSTINNLEKTSFHLPNTTIIYLHEAYRSLLTRQIIAPPSKITLQWRSQLQILLFKEQYRNEKLAIKQAQLSSKPNVVIISDRSLVDNATYIPIPFHHFHQSVPSLSNLEACKTRYSLVFHYQTLASLKPWLFNDGVRLDTPKAAIAIDERIKRNWLPHSHMISYPAKQSLNAKIYHCQQTLSQLINPNPVSGLR